MLKLHSLTEQVFAQQLLCGCAVGISILASASNVSLLEKTATRAGSQRVSIAALDFMKKTELMLQGGSQRTSSNPEDWPKFSEEANSDIILVDVHRLPGKGVAESQWQRKG